MTEESQAQKCDLVLYHQALVYSKSLPAFSESERDNRSTFAEENVLTFDGQQFACSSKAGKAKD